MIITISLIVLLAVGILLCRKIDSDWNILGVVIVVIIGLLLLLHGIAIGTKGYDYREADARRGAIVETLKEFRAKGDAIERAAIVKDIIKFNSDLAAKKYYLETMWGIYTDKRFSTMQPIQP